MTWEIKLIAIYFKICEYSKELFACSERQSNNNNPAFTDAEVMTIYLFCSMDKLKLHSKKSMHKYAERHLRCWFPKLPKYEAFNARVNALSGSFKLLGEILFPISYKEKAEYQTVTKELLLDSLPIMLAKNQRAERAKVAPELADKGYCATKNSYYYGLKLHSANLMSADNSLPYLYCCAITAASVHDNLAFKENIAPNCPYTKIYADSAYMDKAAQADLLELYQIEVCPIQKRVRGQVALPYDIKCQNMAISSVRQSIEVFFNWLIELTNIQNASKCRSSKAVLTHIFGKIAVASLFLIFFNF